MGDAPYGIVKHVPVDYDRAVQIAREALKEQGFGVLTEIDVKKTMQEKTGADFRRYVILGACNPQLAHRALTAEPDIGLMLPCNVVVYEEDGGSVVEAVSPMAMLSFVDSPDMKAVADEAQAKLAAAMETVVERAAAEA